MRFSPYEIKCEKQGTVGTLLYRTFYFLYPHEQCVYVHHARRPSHLDTVNDRLQCDHGRRYGIALSSDRVLRKRSEKSYHVGNIPLWTLAAGNFLSSLVHIFAMSLVIFFTAPAFFDAKVPADLTAYFLLLLLLIVVSLSVGMVFGLYSKSSSKVGMATQLIFMPSMIMSGIMFPVTMLPEALQTAGKVLPATWGFEAMCAADLQFGNYYPLLIIMAIALALSLLRLRKISID